MDNQINLYEGDCLKVMKDMIAKGIQVDSVVTDPPYHLTSIVSRFKGTSQDDDNKTGKAAKAGSNNYARLSKGFMGQTWDGGDIAFRKETWELVFQVLKPGGHVLAFGGTRTFHRMACAIEDAGFEIRDTIMWLYGTGFPKSHKVGDGWGTALKPAVEPIVLARKPLSENTVAGNVLKHGTGGLNIDECRISHVTIENGTLAQNTHLRSHVKTSGGRSIFGNTKEHRYEIPSGRWPANVIHDGSEEVLENFPESKSGKVVGGQPMTKGFTHSTVAKRADFESYNDDGSAARFFYSSKVSKKERGEENTHPTVKPVDLMRYLITLVTPKGGSVLDPFMGSGSTGIAAKNGGWIFHGIEAEPKYFKIAQNRIGQSSEYATLEGFFQE